MAITAPGNIRPNPRTAPAMNFLIPSSSLLNLSSRPVTASMTGSASFINVSPIGAIAALSLSIAPMNLVDTASSIRPSSPSAISASSDALFVVSSITL